MTYLNTDILADLGVEPGGDDPAVQGEQAAHAVEDGEQSADGDREDVEAGDEVFGEHLEGEQEQVRRGGAHGVLVVTGEAAQHVGERQEEADDGAHHDVELEQAVALEHLQRLRGAVVGEHQAGQQEGVDGKEDREHEVHHGHQPRRREHDDERHQLQLDHAQRPHDPPQPRSCVPPR